MTLARPGETPIDGPPEGPSHPVKRSLESVVPVVKILMAALLRPKNRIRPRLAGMTVSVKDGLPVYVPFRETPHEYVHSRVGLGIHKNMVRPAR